MKLRQFITAGVFAVSSTVFCGELGLSEILNILYKESPDIKNIEIETEKMRLEKRKDFKKMFPGLTLGINHELIKDTYNDKERGDWDVSGIGPQNVAVYVNLYSGGADYNRYKKSSIGYDIAQKDESLERFKLEEKAIAQYFKILNLRKQVEINRSAIDTLMKQKRRVTSLFENGKMVSKTEVLEVSAAIVETEAEKGRKEMEYRNAVEELYLMLGINLGSENSFKEFSPEMFEEKAIALNSDLETARKNSSAVKKYELQVERAARDIDIARAEYLPKIDVVPEYRFKKDDDEHDYQVRLLMSWNIFNWGASTDNMQQKKDALLQQKIKSDKEIDGVMLKLRNKYREIDTLKEEVKAGKLRVELLQENLKIQNRRYESSLASSLDYLQSVNLLKSAEKDYYSKQRDLVLAFREYGNLLK